MIRHIVATKFKASVTEQENAQICADLAALTVKLSAPRGFTAGSSDSPERFQRGYKHAFVIDFDDWADLKAYTDDPERKELGALLVDNTVGGADGILVMDLNIEN